MEGVTPHFPRKMLPEGDPKMHYQGYMRLYNINVTVNDPNSLPR